MLQVPFPYFGGKSRIAGEVWGALGNCGHYMEPFFGSGAVLLLRPGYDPMLHTETVCDVNGYVCNVWRALKFAPEAVAEWCDWPVNHADLAARRKRLILEKQNLLDKLIDNEEWFEPKIAGYWIWATCCWIGNGLTDDAAKDNRRPHLTSAGKGILAKRPHLEKKGINAKMPHVDNRGVKIHKRPSLSNKGIGIQKLGAIPHLNDGGKGCHKQSITGCTENIYDWFRNLAQRLRRVRVVCGDWSRICGGNWHADHFRNSCGIFLTRLMVSETAKKFMTMTILKLRRPSESGVSSAENSRNTGLS